MKNHSLKNFSIEEQYKWLKEAERFKQIFTRFRDYTKPDFIKEIFDLIKKGVAEVKYKADPGRGIWDGDIYIKFNYQLDAKDIVSILGLASCDSFSMKDNFNLHLWWD